jgi:hypothetical protein
VILALGRLAFALFKRYCIKFFCKEITREKPRYVTLVARVAVTAPGYSEIESCRYKGKQIKVWNKWRYYHLVMYHLGSQHRIGEYRYYFGNRQLKHIPCDSVS